MEGVLWVEVTVAVGISQAEKKKYSKLLEESSEEKILS